MQTSKRNLFLFNALGGAAVLGSYVHGLLTHPQPGRTLWGGLPKSLRPLYTGSMLLAAGGFIGMISYLAKRPEARILGGRLPLSAIYVPLGVIHAASTLWMPLTFAYADSRSPARWAAVRIDLALVGLGALALIPAVATATPRGKGFAAALAGTGAFAFHTAVLDALVWPALYHGLNLKSRPFWRHSLLHIFRSRSPAGLAERSGRRASRATISGDKVAPERAARDIIPQSGEVRTNERLRCGTKSRNSR